jgi:hypothetical protein
MKPSSILLAIPDYGGTIKTPCFRSVIDAFQLLSRLGIKAGILTYNLSDIAISRNIMASIFLQQPSHSHLLFIDSDMEFRPETLAKMIAVEKPLVGCAYPRRDIDISKLAELVRDRPIGQAMAGSMTFSVRTLEGPVNADPQGLCQVAGIGMGLTLISREVFNAMLATRRIAKTSPQTGTNLPETVFGFFDRYPELTEDFSFCRRWIDLCKGEVWCLLNEDVGHIGAFTYRAKMGDWLKLESQTPSGDIKA